MARRVLEYTKLPGGARGPVTHHTLWEGPDHLLRLRRQLYHEGYRRFYYKDIQAVTCWRTGAGTAQAVVFFVLAGLFGWTAWVAVDVWRFVFLTLALFAAGILLIHLLRGPTCRCRIRTAVQTEYLPSLGRLRPAMAAMDRIRRRVAEAQGGVIGAETLAREFSRSDDQRMEPGDKIAFGGGTVQLLLCLVVAVQGLVVLMPFYSTGLAALVAGILLSMATGVLAIVALVKPRRGERRSPAWQNLAGGALGFFSLNLLFYFVLYIAAIVREPVASNNPLEVLRIMSSFEPLESGVLTWTLGVLGAYGLLLGGIGLLLHVRERRFAGNRMAAGTWS